MALTIAKIALLHNLFQPRRGAIRHFPRLKSRSAKFALSGFSLAKIRICELGLAIHGGSFSIPTSDRHQKHGVWARKATAVGIPRVALAITRTTSVVRDVPSPVIDATWIRKASTGAFRNSALLIPTDNFGMIENPLDISENALATPTSTRVGAGGDFAILRVRIANVGADERWWALGWRLMRRLSRRFAVSAAISSIFMFQPESPRIKSPGCRSIGLSARFC